ncbi:sigma-70 family RNA polymerase sigma factor [Clostridium botulinum]|uniref:Sigma-70 family RNA polymerase sigma factor n=1 Tax=Clostridium botulinum TaxID=1491 RepID=A0A6B4JKA2_CLOBO|nr:sigma-70 family RNA polymerase sigma factor [Clostridium botulinum]EES50752.1 specialized sigma subunit of RNA polymerase [Clostridium botulinum E1 str. 'BoNT E Beluga']MBY6760167.1 sigma-70 family RNA polymerase sigma factor [Clostridium botulinum]MBY6919076.1 sigma-70 family RNA polymerase sigma factor [Clostridium botulinum]MCR1132199.1 sigma-70 family RNA polymerase sigma factor [Clostridium botulinum]NFJ57281.1 sigma-70 family RNA polymerase sigma factor [Clostridium botulinum]
MGTVKCKRDEDEIKIASKEVTVDKFTQIYDTYYKRVFKYICYRINDQHEAEELCSKIFERIIIKYSSFGGNDDSLDSWIFTIARNTITDHYRSKNKRFHFSLDYIIDMVSPKPSLDELILTKENNSYLFKALRKLNERERSVVSLKYGAALKNTEIAKIMELSESNVSVILCRSLKKLKKILVSEGFKYE